MTIQYVRSMISKSFHQKLVYRSNIANNLFNAFVLLAFQICLWNALYQSGHQNTSSLSETLTYLVLSTIVLQVFRFDMGRMIGEAVYSGEVAVDLLRPVSLQVQNVSRSMGDACFRMLTETAPTLLLASLAVHLQPPAGGHAFFVFVLTALLGTVIYNLFDCIVGYSAFWFLNNWYMPWFKRALFTVFGGVAIPLWFYPQVLRSIAAYLPFQHIGFTPIEIYLGRIAPSGFLRVIGIQCLWIGLLFLLERFVWRLAQKKILIQGG